MPKYSLEVMVSNLKISYATRSSSADLPAARPTSTIDPLALVCA